MSRPGSPGRGDADLLALKTWAERESQWRPEDRALLEVFLAATRRDCGDGSEGTISLCGALDFGKNMSHTYGMAVMEHRTSFALDEVTISRLRHLSELWRVSQAEVVRRAVERAEAQARGEIAERLERLRAFHSRGGLAAERAEAYLADVAADRAEWGRGK